MQRKTRLAVLLAALAGVAAWAALGDKDRPEVTQAAAPAAVVAAQPVLAAAQEQASDMPARPSLEQMGTDPFNVEAPQPQATPEAAPPAAPARAVPPPLPYRYAGRMQIGDETDVYLAKGDELITVKKGDKLVEGYRVERIGRTEMTLVHLASGAREKLEYPPLREEEPAVVQTKAQRPRARAHALSQAPAEPHGGAQLLYRPEG